MLIIDGHCDTLSRCRTTGQSLESNSLHWDIRRAMQAGIGIQFMALYNDESNYQGALAATLEQIALLKRAELEGRVEIITRGAQIDNRSRLGAILHLEGGLALGSTPDILPLLYQLGLRSLGLTWNHRNQLADGVGVTEPQGLTELGQEIIKQAGDLGMLLDIAHLAAPGVDEILDNYLGVVVYTHGNYREVHDHPRNITRQQAQRLAKRDGVIGLSLYPHFISAQPCIEDWVNHILHLCDQVGCEHVALGSDYDGDDSPLLGGDVTFYQGLSALLSNAGFTTREIELITSENWLRVLKRILPDE